MPKKQVDKVRIQRCFYYYELTEKLTKNFARPGYEPKPVVMESLNQKANGSFDFHLMINEWHLLVCAFNLCICGRLT